MDWKSLGQKVAGLGLPILGTALGGPAGGAVAGVIAKALGCNETPDAIDQAISADPEAVLKLRQAQMENDRLIETAYLADRQDARKREVDIAKATGEKDINLYVLAWMVVVGFFTLVGLMYAVNLPAANVGPLNQLLGALAAGFGMVLSYFFGTSKSSRDKDKVISKQS